MAWNKKNESNDSHLFNSLENTYIELLSDFDQIKDFQKNMSSLEINEYKTQQKFINITIKSFQNKVSTIYQAILDIKQYPINSKQKEKISRIDENLREKQNQLKEIIPELIEQEKTMNRKFSFYSIKERPSADSGKSDKVDNKQILQFEDNKKDALLVQEIEIRENFAFLEERTRELEDINLVTGQIKDISGNMVIQTHKQGQLINSLEDNVVDVKENIVNADREVKEADVIQKKSNKCLLIIGLIVLVVVLIIIAVVLAKVL